MSDETGAAASPSAAGSSPASATPSTPATTSPSTPASATATPSAPASPEGSSSTPPPTGVPPEHRWPSILANARAEAQREAEQRFRQQYGWAEQFQANPYGHFEQLFDTFSNHQEYGPQLLAKAARMLQARRGQSAVAEKPQPDIPIFDANGHDTGRRTYSAEQLEKLDEWKWSQREAALAEKNAPLQQLRDAYEQQQQYAAMQHEATGLAQSTLTDLRQDPLFAEHEPKVKQALIDHPEWGADVSRAYSFVLATQILPGEQGKVLTQLKTQAAGSTVSPGVQTATQTPKFKTFGDAIRYYAEHPEEAAVMQER